MLRYEDFSALGCAVGYLGRRTSHPWGNGAFINALFTLRLTRRELYNLIWSNSADEGFRKLYK